MTFYKNSEDLRSDFVGVGETRLLVVAGDNHGGGQPLLVGGHHCEGQPWWRPSVGEGATVAVVVGQGRGGGVTVVRQCELADFQVFWQDG